MSEKICTLCQDNHEESLICAECQGELSELMQDISENQAAAIREISKGNFTSAMEYIFEAVREQTQKILMEHKPEYPYNESDDSLTASNELSERHELDENGEVTIQGEELTKE